MSIASLFDLSGRGTRSYLTSGASGGTFRERFGESLDSADDKRLREFSQADMARTSNTAERQLEKMKVQTVEMTDGDLVATTGQGRNRAAKSVDQQFQPLDNSVSFRLAAGPIRA